MLEGGISTEALMIYPIGIQEAVCTSTRHQGRETPITMYKEEEMEPKKMSEKVLISNNRRDLRQKFRMHVDLPSVSAIATSSGAGCEALSETRPTSSVDLIHPFHDHFLLERDYRPDSKSQKAYPVQRGRRDLSEACWESKDCRRCSRRISGIH